MGSLNNGDVVALANSIGEPSVIVVGGGFAGISAARVLQDASIHVILLESRERLGGRVHTDYSFDLGASWLHGLCKENPLAHLIGSLNHSIYRTSEEDSVLYDHDLNSYELYDDEGKEVTQEFVTQVGITFQRILEEVTKLRDDLNTDISLKQAISIVFERNDKLRGLPLKVLNWYICRLEGWFAADADTVSLRYFDKEELLPGGHGLMVHGYLPVLESLSAGLDIRLNSRVKRIEDFKEGVTVTIEDGTTLSADAVVVTVPLGVLKSGFIAFEPALPEWKQKAIYDLGLGTGNKIVLKFENAFWPDVEYFGMVGGTTHECTYYLNLHKATGNPVLVYMAAGRLAKDLEKMTDADAADYAFEELQKIFPDAPAPTQFLVSRWGSNINSLGSYSYDVVGNCSDLYEKLSSPVDNLFFAGEATCSKFAGAVHGAYYSGLVAAEACVAHVFQRLGLSKPVMPKKDRGSLSLKISRR